ncbi:MAG: hypothetical protein R3245_03700 [Kiloniellales bacterium]|nr:hypothetical protein [Kiloniellales bacterium]
MRKVMLAGLAFAVAGCIASGDRANCTQESLLGSWRADWRLEIWTFEPDGTLACEGICNYGVDFGYPERWEADPSANLWSSGVEYLKLHFTETTFEGTEGAFRCDVFDNGEKLILDPIAGPPFTFTKAPDRPEA